MPKGFQLTVDWMWNGPPPPSFLLHISKVTWVQKQVTDLSRTVLLFIIHSSHFYPANVWLRFQGQRWAPIPLPLLVLPHSNWIHIPRHSHRKDPGPQWQPVGRSGDERETWPKDAPHVEALGGVERCSIALFYLHSFIWNPVSSTSVLGSFLGVAHTRQNASALFFFPSADSSSFFSSLLFSQLSPFSALPNTNWHQSHSIPFLPVSPSVFPIIYKWLHQPTDRQTNEC